MSFGGPNQTATPNPVVDFTPQKNYPSFSTIINQYFNPTTYTGTANVLIPSDVLGGLLILTNGAAITATVPPASSIVPQIQAGQGPLPGISPSTTGAGSTILFFVKAGGAGGITVSAGAGGTLVGSGAITAGATKLFALTVTAIGLTPTYTLYSLITSAS